MALFEESWTNSFKNLNKIQVNQNFLNFPEIDAEISIVMSFKCLVKIFFKKPRCNTEKNFKNLRCNTEKILKRQDVILKKFLKAMM